MRLYKEVLEEDLFSNIYRLLKEEILFFSMMHKGGEVPRLIAVQADIQNGIKPIYRYPFNNHPETVDFTPFVKLIKNEIEEIIGEKFNHCSIQLHRNGKEGKTFQTDTKVHGNDYISEQSDKTLDITKGTTIVSYSAGALTRMIIRNKLSREKMIYELPHNSLFILNWNDNKHFVHSIKQDKREDKFKSEEELAYNNERISLTFRNISTFELPDGRIFGQGSRYKTIEELPQLRKYNDLLDYSTNYENTKLLESFSNENKQHNFIWEENYKIGFLIKEIL
jgi:hypothetical protein